MSASGAADDSATDVAAAMTQEMQAIRKRVLEEATERAHEEAKERIREEIERSQQVSLNDDENAAALEDAGLADHREKARHRLAQHEAAMSKLAKLGDLRTQGNGAVGSLAVIIRAIGDRAPQEDDQHEQLFRHSKALADIAEGKAAHGYPAVGEISPEVKAVLLKASGEIRTIAEAREASFKALESDKVQLQRTRIQAESAVTGMIDYIDSANEDRRLLREAFVRSDTDPSVKGPSHSAGEKMLSSTRLPETS